MAYRITEKGRKKREKRRNEILQAAKELFASQGFRETTMQQIVDEAGTSIGNCYFYFKNKNDVLKSVVEDLLIRVWDTVHERIKDVPEWHKRMAIEVYLAVTATLSEGDLAYMVLSATPEIRRFTMAFIYDRVKSYLDVPELREKFNMDLLVNVWAGNNLQMLEKRLAGKLDVSPDELAKFLVRWNLKAVGLSDEKVQEAHEALKDVEVLEFS